MSVESLGFAEALAKLANERKPFAVATVVRVEGSSLGKPGFKMIIDDEGRIVYGTLGGVCPEGPIIAVAQEVIKKGTPRLVRVYLESTENSIIGMIRQQSGDEIHVETFCGGVMEIFVDAYLPPSRLILIAQGGRDDVEETLVKMGKLLGFEVWVIDPLPVLATQPDKLITEVDYDFNELKLGERDYVVVLTKGERDIKVLEALSKTRPRFVGMLASRKRVKYDFSILRDKGVSEEFLKSVSAPVGADIGAHTPEEIALSIMAEIVAVRRGKRVPRKDEEALEEVKETGVATGLDIGGSCGPTYTKK